MTWDTLSDNLQVVWGALIALAIVVLLTPAVGGMARMLGVVDREESGRRSREEHVPRLGGLALFFGIFVPSLAFLRLTARCAAILLGAAIATTVGAIDDFRGLRWWEKLAGQVAAAGVVTLGRRLGARVHLPDPRRRSDLPKPLGVALTIVGIVAVMNMVNFLDGLDGLAAGVCAISAFSFCVHRPLARRDQRRDPDGRRLRRLHRLPAPQLLSGPDLHGRLRRAPARLHAGRRLGAGPVENGRLDGPRPAAARPRRAADRHLVRRREADQARQAGLRRRPDPPAPPLPGIGFSERRSVVYLYIWCATLALAAFATHFVHPHPGTTASRRDHPSHGTAGVALDAAIGLLAIGASVYVVYLLEIVKLANPFIRRRERGCARRAKKRRASSA